MAKKAAKAEDNEATSTRAKLYDDFSESIFGADYILNEDRKIISVSPSFDLSTGGIPEGSLVCLTGPPKVGKSVLALTIAAAAQKLKYANPILCPQGRKVVYFNVEHRIKKRDLEGINNLDLSPERFDLIQSSPGKILSSEDFCTLVERYINEVPGCVAIIDSFSMLSSQAEISADIGYQDRGKSHGIISQLMRRISGPLSINKAIVIGVTHQVANSSGYGAAMIEKSANALKYQEDIKLQCKSIEPWRIGSDAKSPQIGQKINWLVQFSAIAAPGGHVCNHLRYGHGIDVHSELIQIGQEYGLISGTTWQSFTFLGKGDESPKYQGSEKARQALIDNPEWYDELKKQCYETAGLTI